ncbi:hypothetical protein BKA82DRAFT_34906, partial [Pisolithus tinctorius]
ISESLYRRFVQNYNWPTAIDITYVSRNGKYLEATRGIPPLIFPTSSFCIEKQLEQAPPGIKSSGSGASYGSQDVTAVSSDSPGIDMVLIFYPSPVDDSGDFQNRSGHSLPPLDVPADWHGPLNIVALVASRPPPIYNGPIDADPNAPCDDHAVIQCELFSKFASEELEDLNDALSPIYDQLKIAPCWWIPEMLPQKLWYQREEDDKWVMHIRLNMGKGRHIPAQGRETLRVHRMVKIRMDTDGLQEGKYSESEIRG